MYSIYTKDNIRTFLFRTQIKNPGEYSQQTLPQEYLRIVRVIQGNGVWQIKNMLHDVQTGDILLFNNMEQRLLRVVNPPSDMVFEVIEFMPLTIYPNIHCAVLFFCRNEHFNNILRTKSMHYENAVKQFETIRAEVESNNMYKDECILACLMNLIIHLSRAHEKFLQNDTELRRMANICNYEILCGAVKYISENFKEDISETNMARQYGMNAPNFSHLFKMFNGISVSSYIRMCRLTHTFELLRSHKMNILDAAYESGFGSSSGFYKAVKNATGMTPTEILQIL